MSIIFFNIGWMKQYKGIKEDDKLVGGFGYILENETGHEQYNFLPHRGDVYGYAPIRWDKGKKEFERLNINNLGAGAHDESIEGVTVVFISKSPTTRTTYIVGWYKNATVYRRPQKLALKGRVLNGDNLYYICKAKEEDTICLPESERVFAIPTAQKERGGYGQSTIWYAPRRKDIQEKVLRYIESGEVPYRVPERSQDGLSQEDKKRVETTAVDATKAFFRKLGFRVQSVEGDNCGWDLLVYNAIEEFYVEVKGTAGKIVNFQLTPNEYANLKKHWRKYKIAVATSCLGKPELSIYSIWHNTKKNKYFGHTDKGKPIQLTEQIAAIGSLIS